MSLACSLWATSLTVLTSTSSHHHAHLNVHNLPFFLVSKSSTTLSSLPDGLVSSPWCYSQKHNLFPRQVVNLLHCAACCGRVLGAVDLLGRLLGSTVLVQVRGQLQRTSRAREATGRASLVATTCRVVRRWTHRRCSAQS